MTAGERFKNWIDGLSLAWKDRLRGWMASWLINGIRDFLELEEPAAIDNVQEMMDKIQANPDISPELKAILARLKGGGAWFMIVMAVVMSVQAIIGLVTTLWQPGMKQASYSEERAAKTFRLDPFAVITAWRRDKPTYEKYFDDLRDQGWSEERIEALKFLTLFIPTADEQTLWLAREVYEKDMVERYGLDSELPRYEDTDFSKVGVDPDQMANKWAAHWEHASFMQVIEMLHRGTLSLDKEMPAPPTTKEGWAARDAEGEKALYDWYRLVEIPPFWRSRLTAMSWNVPTRVDVRRWWDMRTIDEAELYNVYHRQGYRGKDLDNYVLWTKVYVAFPDLMARWSKGWISLEDVRTELTALGMPAKRLEEFIQMKVKATEGERVEKERNLTKADIYKGVKTGAITRGEAMELLMDLGFEEDEADYLLFINIPSDEEDVVVAERKISKADILKGLKIKEITRDEARTMLMELRYSSSDSELLLKIYEAQVKVPEEPKLREASKADIVLGVTKGLIDQSEGYAMLLDLGFTPEASDFILMVKTEESPFSPINFAEFKDLTSKYRRAAGMEIVEMPEELKKAAGEVVRLTGEVEALERSIVEEKRGLIEGEPIPEAATKRLKSLQVKRNRAISELERVKSEYDKLVAEWRHGLP